VFLALVAGRCDAVEVGATAPAFEMTARDGSVHSLQALSSGSPVLLDFGSVAEAYGVEAIPYLVLVDGAGTVRAVHLGRSPDPAAALGLDALLAEQGEKK
jgi:peroxiredoxin